HAGRAAGDGRRQAVLARSPLVSGEHQPHQGSRALVQELVSAAHGRQEAVGSAGVARADQTSARTIQSVRKEPSRWPDPQEPTPFSRPPKARSFADFLRKTRPKPSPTSPSLPKARAIGRIRSRAGSRKTGCTTAPSSIA